MIPSIAPDIHEEIEKFWINGEAKIVVRYGIYYYLSSLRGYTFEQTIGKLASGKIEYWFENKHYSEQEMLRIIKLVSFM